MALLSHFRVTQLAEVPAPNEATLRKLPMAQLWPSLSDATALLQSELAARGGSWSITPRARAKVPAQP